MSKAGDYSTASNSVWSWNPETPNQAWKTLPRVPGLGLISHSVAAVDGKIYVPGGAMRDGAGVVNVKSAYRFEYVTVFANKIT
jgi:N-acetylneuraminic acid mutarotase